MNANNELYLQSIRSTSTGFQIKLRINSMISNPKLIIKARQSDSFVVCLDPVKCSKSHVSYQLNTSVLPADNLYFDLYYVFKSEDGGNNPVRLKAESHIKAVMMNVAFQAISYVTHESTTYRAAIYAAANRGISIQLRERDTFDTLSTRLKEWLAFMTLPLVYWRYKDTVLMYEKFSNYARDNAYYYFMYLQRSTLSPNVYFIIRKDSPDIGKFANKSRQVVYFMSFKHLQLLLCAKYLIASEAKGHSYAWRHNQSIVRFVLNRKPFVFLQHGVLGLKQVDHTFFADNRLNHAELFMTSSDIEKQIVEQYLGYNEKNIAVTGLARWDNTEHLTKTRTIFVMPTWRTQLELVSEAEFLKSDFYLQYRDLLNSTELDQALQDNDFTMNFMLHPKFVKYEHYFHSNSSRINIVRQQDVSIDVELKTSALTITDYSSIMWDALYYNIPVYLFQFDQADYLARQGSYLDMNRDLGELVVMNADTLIKRLSRFMKSGQSVDIAGYQSRYFAYHDHENSARIHQAIENWERDFHFETSLQRFLKRSSGKETANVR